MHLDELIQACRGRLVGEPFVFNALSIDSRTLKPKDIFIAIKGENFDGHTFVQDAIKAGASACIVDHDIEDLDVPQIIVEDTTHALGQIAHHHRSKFSSPFIAVTGSCGKTTVKQMMASIFAQAGEVFSSKGNFNNHIGLPLSLLNLPPSVEYGVFELGASHLGEIAYLAALLEPSVGIITTVAPAHIEGFGSVDNVAKAKGEIYESIVPGGTAVAEVDSPYLSMWQSARPDLKWLTFGVNADAKVYATDIEREASGHYRFTLNTPSGTTSVVLPILGEHNVKNATAAAAAGIALGVSLDDIKRGLEAMQNVGGRLDVKQLSNGSFVIDDTYNANPSSVYAAIDALKGYTGKRVLVLGDMAELGPEAKRYHEEVGAYAKAQGIDRFYGIGNFSTALLDGFGQNGGFVAANKADLIAALKGELGDASVFLVKGSRSAKMEEVVAGLLENNQS